jgi:hypothetical protein
MRSSPSRACSWVGEPPLDQPAAATIARQLSAQRRHSSAQRRLCSSSLFAGFRAALAGLGADAAGLVMEVGAAQDEVTARLAGLSAISRRAQVAGRGVLAALLQAEGRRLDADVVTVGTALDADAHLRADVRA